MTVRTTNVTLRDDEEDDKVVLHPPERGEFERFGLPLCQRGEVVECGHGSPFSRAHARGGRWSLVKTLHLSIPHLEKQAGNSLGFCLWKSEIEPLTTLNSLLATQLV